MTRALDGPGKDLHQARPHPLTLLDAGGLPRPARGAGFGSSAWIDRVEDLGAGTAVRGERAHVRVASSGYSPASSPAARWPHVRSLHQTQFDQKLRACRSGKNCCRPALCRHRLYPAVQASAPAPRSDASLPSRPRASQPVAHGPVVHHGVRPGPRFFRRELHTQVQRSDVTSHDRISATPFQEDAAGVPPGDRLRRKRHRHEASSRPACRSTSGTQSTGARRACRRSQPRFISRPSSPTAMIASSTRRPGNDDRAPREIRQVPASAYITAAMRPPEWATEARDHDTSAPFRTGKGQRETMANARSNSPSDATARGGRRTVRAGGSMDLRRCAHQSPLPNSVRCCRRRERDAGHSTRYARCAGWSESQRVFACVLHGGTSASRSGWPPTSNVTFWMSATEKRPSHLHTVWSRRIGRAGWQSPGVPSAGVEHADG